MDSITNTTNIWSCVPEEFKSLVTTARHVLKHADCDTFKTGYELQYVPNELKTEELCRIALGNSGSAVKYVPLKFKLITLLDVACAELELGKLIDRDGKRTVPDRTQEQLKAANLIRELIHELKW
jgi:hypothetical protein